MNQFEHLIGESEPNHDVDALRAVNEISKTPGVIFSVDPELAEFMGAFVEDAMSIEAALESRFDQASDSNNEAV